ncbi:MAG: CRTAC1 family protein [Candidatus Sulfotelmatobacter sp.]
MGSEHTAVLILSAILGCSLLSADLSAQNSTPAAQSDDAARAHAAKTNAPPNPHIFFREIAPEAAVTTAPNSRTDRRYVLETAGGGGIALFDCDNDGKLDIAVVNDSTIERFRNGGDPMLTLYHQDGNSQAIHFTDITKSSGLTTRGWGMAIAVGDYDNDGLPDLYVTGYGHNVLYHNLGNCKFEDVTSKAGVQAGGFSTGAAWADYDRDGNLDLFVARYVKTDVNHLPDPARDFRGYRGVPFELPDSMEGETDILFGNRGDGTFEDVSKKARVSDPDKRHGMGVTWGDYDGDGWPDLYVTNDFGPTFMYHNLHNGTFEEVGFPMGTAVAPNGRGYGNMAGDFGDFDRDGKLDLFVTRADDQPASLYRNEGEFFTDVAREAGLAAPTKAPVKWGAGFADFDNDGWLDILIANGNFSSLLDKDKEKDKDTLPKEYKFAQPIQLFRNRGNLTFEDVSGTSGLNAGQLYSRRGTAFGDINNDGKLDVVVFNANAPPSVFLNETKTSNHAVLLRLIGTKSNRAAIGARVRVITSKMTQIDEVHAGGSYNSTNDTRLHFGLGSESTIKKIEVQWPSGAHQEFNEVPADAIYELKEGEASRKAAPLSH